MKGKMKMNYQQGDVLVKKIDAIPKGAVKKEYREGYSVLAWGEITGHAHCLVENKTELFEFNQQMFLRVKEDTDLLHQKLNGSKAVDAHTPITLPKGDYYIGIVKEYDYFTDEARYVAD